MRVYCVCARARVCVCACVCVGLATPGGRDSMSPSKEKN